MRNKTFTQFVKQSAIKMAFAVSLMAFGSSANAATVPVTFKVDMTGVDVTGGTGVYIVGDFVGTTINWKHQAMTLEQNNVYSVTLQLDEGAQNYFYFTIHTNWADAMRETKPMPAPCGSIGTEKTGGWAGDRFITVPVGGTTVSYYYGSCSAPTGIKTNTLTEVSCTPNPATDKVTITVPEAGASAVVEFIDLGGKIAISQDVVFNNGQTELSVSKLSSGLYVVLIKTTNKVYTAKLNVK